jgi:DNA polymerase/3'-5' exonuclease PolX
MSNTTKYPYAEVMEIAQRLVLAIAPYCEREPVIAGSLRRKKEMVGDIEIVAVPKLHKDLFGVPVLTGGSEVDVWMNSQGIWPTASGPKMKQFYWGGMKVDLFLQPDPATWGVNLMIRTGSAEFSHWMVTPQGQGGACPDALSFKDARIWRNGKALLTPEEEDVFHILGLAWIAPEDRDMYKRSDYTGSSLI